MSYRINKFDGTVLTDVIDGTIDQITTDLTLVGSDVSGYGELMNENFVHLLENFADESSPPNPIVGQLWYDLSESLLKIYDGSSFNKIAGTIVESSDTPVSQTPGDIWIQSDTHQLFFHDGAGFRLAGPLYTQSQGVSGFKIISSLDTTSIGYEHTVVCLFCKDQLIGIISNDSFQPNNGIYNYSGKVHAGFTFINPDPVNNEFNLKLEKIVFSDGGNDGTDDDDSFIRLGRSLTTYPIVDYPHRPGVQGEQDTDIIISTPTNINVKGSRITNLLDPVEKNDAVNAGWFKITISRNVSGMAQSDAISTILQELKVLSPETEYFDSMIARVLCYGNGQSYIVTYQIQNNEWAVTTDNNGNPIIEQVA